MAADSIFIDTNVLVYANQLRSPFHASAVSLLASVGDRGLKACLSQQVLREYYGAVTRPQAEGPALDPSTAAIRIATFRAEFEVLANGAAVMDRLIDLVAAYRVSGKQIHDANIVATMITHGVRRLATFNPSDFRRFADIIDIEPL
nr:PIN domain-containing protein [Hansschlegelia quercus]